VWTSPNLTATSATNYSYSVGIIPAGVYKLECERLGTTLSQSIFIDNVLLAYVDTNTVVDCDGKGDYAYSFNGMRKDDEIKGENNSYDFGARLYDNRLGRWLTIDPLEFKYPFLTPYSYAANNPIIFIDRGGMDIWTFYENGSFKYEKTGKLDGTGEIGDKIYYIYNDGTKIDLAQPRWYHVLPGGGTPAQAIKDEFFSRPEALALVKKTNPKLYSNVCFTNILEWVAFAGDCVDFVIGLGELKAALKAGGKLIFTFAKSSGKLILREGAFILKKEERVVDLLVKEGKTVEKLAESTKHGETTADFLVDGINTELSQISKTFKADDGSKAINRLANRMKDKIARGQAKDYIFDLAETDLTEDQAKKALASLTKKLKDGGHQINSIRVVGKGYDIKQ